MDFRDLHRSPSHKDTDEDPRVVTTLLKTEAEHLDEENVINKIQLHRGKELRGRFKINSVEQNCILMDLEAKTSIFQDKDAFMKALRPLLSMIIDYGHIDRNLRGSIKINLTFKDLTEGELNVFQELTKQERYNCFRCRLFDMEVNNLKGIESELQNRLQTEIHMKNKFEQETLNLQYQLRQAQHCMKQEELSSKITDETNQGAIADLDKYPFDTSSHSDSTSQASGEYYYERTALNRSFTKDRFDRISISSDTSAGALSGEMYIDVDQQSQVHYQETAAFVEKQKSPTVSKKTHMKKKAPTQPGLKTKIKDKATINKEEDSDSGRPPRPPLPRSSGKKTTVSVSPHDDIS